MNKFLNPVELTYEKFNTFYNDYSLPNKKFFKLDAFVKMPAERENADYLKKIGAFLKSICNFYCNAKPSFDNIKFIYGSCSFTLKDGSKNINIPILIEVQVHEADKVKTLRVSLRGGSGPIISSIYQLFITFFG